MSMRVLILGINGFVGHRLTETILSKTDWEIYGMDLSSYRLEHCFRYSRLHFEQGDITKHKDWVNTQIEQADVILPLVTIASPFLYVEEPLRLFEIDFESNLEIIKQVHAANKHLIFPSSSDVYGMCEDQEFDEDSSRLVVGPIAKERWLNSSAKQLLDRLIYAYGHHHGLKYTIFRPFNWIGPKQDEVLAGGTEHSRVVTQFISDIVHNRDMILVNGGYQRRSFTYIEDGIEALMKMIENKENCAVGHIFNIGNPKNNVTIAELAERIKTLALAYPKYRENAEQIELIAVGSKEFYGEGYQDIPNRVPSIENAKKYLRWHPKTDLDIALHNTLDFYLS